MTITLDDVTARKKPEPTPEEVAALAVARRAPGAGPVPDRAGRLLKQLTMTVLETALNEEITEHLGQEENGQSDSETGDVRNGTRAKTVLTEATGQVHIDVPQDRAGDL